MQRAETAAARPETLPFGKGSLAWRVNMEPVVLLGGGRALLLQVMHPSVAAGVAQHSSFEREPFRRGYRTIDIMLKLAFGDAQTSARQAELLRRVHARVKGTGPDGVAYDAMDPALLLWVWATLVEVSLRVYERAVRPLGSDDRERYYEEQKLIGVACGIPPGRFPDGYERFSAYFARVLEEDLRVTEVARVVAYAARRPPMPLVLGVLAGRLGSFVTAGLLPAHLRSELGYEWSPARDRLLASFFALSRLASRVIPRAVRHLPTRYLVARDKPLDWWSDRPVRLPRKRYPG